MRFTFTRQNIVAIFVIGILAIVTPAAVAFASHDAPSTAYGVLEIDEDRFYNWDYASESESRYNVDWPINL